MGARITGTGRGQGPGPVVTAAATLDGNRVVSSDGEDVGKISHIMLDVRGGRVAYAVLAGGRWLSRDGCEAACHSMGRLDA